MSPDYGPDYSTLHCHPFYVIPVDNYKLIKYTNGIKNLILQEYTTKCDLGKWSI